MVEDEYKDAAERLLKESGLSKTELLEILAKRYLTERDPDSPDKLFSEFIHKKMPGVQEVDMNEVVKDREARTKQAKDDWQDKVDNM